MSDFLRTLREDLLSRRLLPLLVLVSAAFVAALAYALLAGGGSAPGGASAALPGASLPAASRVALAEAPANPNSALAETAVGSAYQHARSGRDPFEYLAQAAAAAPRSRSSLASAPSSSPASTSSTASSATGASGSAGSSAGGTGDTHRSASQTTRPAHPASGAGSKTGERSAKSEHSDIVYQVSSMAEEVPGEAAAGGDTTTGPTGPSGPTGVTGPAGTTTSTGTTTSASAALEWPHGSSDDDVLRGLELPSAQEPRLVFAGVLQGGQYAVFKIVGEVFPSDGGPCLPSPLRCEALKLGAGEKETIEYNTASGSPAGYRFEVEAILSHTLPAAEAQRDHAEGSDAGIALLGGSGGRIPGNLRYSSGLGVLVPIHH